MLPQPMLPLVLFGVLLFAAAHVGADAQTDFRAAENALARGDRVEFGRLSERLRDDPLYPYLRFAEITKDLEAASDTSIEAFLDADPDSQLSTRLRRAYLERLSRAGRWSDYLRVYRPDDSVERQCLSLQALIETGKQDSAMEQVAAIWLSGRSRPSVCDPVFDQWRESGHLTPELIWRRIRLAMESGNLGLARFLGRDLPDAEQVWHARWMAVHADPRLVLDATLSAGEHPIRAAMLAHGIARLASDSPRDAALALQRHQDLLGSDPDAADRAHAAVGKAVTASGDRLGLLYWDGMRATEANRTAQEVRLRAAIGLKAWDWIAQWIERMPDSARKRERWLYWLGRAEEQLGRTEAAQASYARAAAQRSFWGFMAADRIGRPYNLTHRPTPATPERIREIVRSPAYQRIRALNRLGRETDVRREWRALTRGMDAEGLMAAAYVADTFRWHDQAVFTLARAGYWDDLELRFPLEYRDLILDQAWQTGIEPEWILAILRQESVFARTIASSAGAIGLMQLMPKTAVQVAEGLGLSAPSRWDLLDPRLNITLGSTYLAEMRDRFGHPALASAAYNAGPSRVKRWLPAHCTEADLWIAAIPFAETRAYVERVMTYRVIYAARLGQEPVRLSTLLPPVPAAGG